MIIAALAGVGLLVALLTWRYWLLTRPGIRFDDDDDDDLAGTSARPGGRPPADRYTGTAAVPDARRARPPGQPGRGRRAEGRDPFWDEPVDGGPGGGSRSLGPPGVGGAVGAPGPDQGRRGRGPADPARRPRRGDAAPPPGGAGRRRTSGGPPPGGGQASDGRRRRGADAGRGVPPAEPRRGRQQPGRGRGAAAPGGQPPAGGRSGGQPGNGQPSRRPRPDPGWGQPGGGRPPDPRPSRGPIQDPGRPPGAGAHGGAGDVDMWGNPRRR
jgi:hypothetical protein